MAGGHVRNRRPNAVLKKHECLFCQRSFSRPQFLEQHILIHTKERPYICSECGICLKSPRHQKDHFRVVHLGIYWTCPYCGQEFNALSNMCAHRKRMHEKGKSKLEVKTKSLPKKSKSKANIHGNPKVKAKPAVKMKSITKTKLKFKSKSSVARKPLSKSKSTHQSSKTKIKQIIKTNPVTKLPKAPEIKASIPNYLGATSRCGRIRKMYKCDICNKIYFSTDLGTLNRHKQNVHGEGPPKRIPKKAVKLWKCDICGRVFRCSDRHSLFRHKATVHGLSPKYLSKSFEQEPNLPLLVLPPPSPPKQEVDVDIDVKYSPNLSTSSFHIPPLDFHFHPPFKLANFPAPLPPRKILDASFFLHMNRYTPDEDVSSSKISPSPFHPPPPPPSQVKQESQENIAYLSPSPEPAVVVVTPKPTIKLEKMDAATTAAKNIERAALSPPPPPKQKAQKTANNLNTIKIELKTNKNYASRHDTRYGPPQTCEKCGKTLANAASFQRHQQIADCVLLKRRLEIPASALWYTCHFCHRDFRDRRSHLLRHIVALHQYPKEENEEKEEDLDKPSCAFCGLKFNTRHDTQQHILLNHNSMLGVPRDGGG